MDEQFEKTENSMSIYYTVNKMLIALHMALLVFFVVMRVYVMVAFCAAGIVDRKSTRLNSSHSRKSRMPSSA